MVLLHRLRNPGSGGCHGVILAGEPSFRRTPWRGGGRLGALILAAGMFLSGCLREAPPPSDPELAEALGLSPRTPIHRISLADREGRIGVFPSVLEIGARDVVQFRAEDRRVYGIRFLEAEMSSASRDFLADRHQLASPPLVEAGARFVVSFEGAPEGIYPFLVEGSGGSQRGEIRLRP